MEPPVRYRYCNREGRWLDFAYDGLELHPDGTLRLHSLPLLDGDPPAWLAALPEPDGPSGVAVVGSDLYFTVPSGHSLRVVAGCDDCDQPAPCLDGPGDGPDSLRSPRGLLYHRRRNALLVADSGNGRIQVLALPDLRLSETWHADGRLVEPVSLSADSGSNVYVADPGARAVQKIDLSGQVVPEFAEHVAADGMLAPAEVAVGEVDGTESVFVLDSHTGRVHVFDLDGNGGSVLETGIERPMGVVVVAGEIYVGDNASRRLVVFAPDGSRVGLAYGYAGPVAAVAEDGREGLLVHAGSISAPVLLSRTGAFRTRGVLWGGPFVNPSDRSNPQHLVRTIVRSIGTDSHLRLYVGTQPSGGSAPPVDTSVAEPFTDPRWHAIAPDAPETLISGSVGDEVWLGLLFTGEGRGSSILEQIRVDFAYQTLLQYLPALYARDAASADLLARWLTLFDSVFGRTQNAIDGLRLLFDPSAVPADALPWLAAWLALELPGAWDEPRRRHAIEAAFAEDARRGTAEGLRRSIRDETGAEVLIEEPIVQTSWWALADDRSSDVETALSVLGVGTVLAAAEPQGAVAGSTAVLDGSYLSPQAEYARPLFDEVAHRFTVRVYRGARYSDEVASAVRVFLDRERPAHTAYHVCVVEPMFRVGVQARVGVDAIVAGPVAPTVLDDAGAAAVVLGGDPAGKVGISSSVGQFELTETSTER
jgi:phage tail-like protein